jgi:DNA-directed RNA polymerase subunit H (RpoH/RPB5)
MLDRKKVLTSRRIVSEMLTDRGLDVEWSEVDSEAATDRTFLESMTGSAEKPDGTTFKVMWTASLSAETVKAAAADFSTEGSTTSHILMVVGAETNAAKEKVGVYNRVNPTHRLEVWRWDLCQFNLVRHVLVPRHSLATQEEFETISRIHHLAAENFPGLLTTDPVCRWYDFPVGGMVKIERSSTSISYRVVRRP